MAVIRAPVTWKCDKCGSNAPTRENDRPRGWFETAIYWGPKNVVPGGIEEHQLCPDCGAEYQKMARIWLRDDQQSKEGQP